MSGAGDMFLMVKGAKNGVIKGESQDSTHKGEIDILSWSWGMQAKPTLGGGTATGEAELIGIIIGTTAASGSALTNVDDEDFATFYESDDVDGWIGVDAGQNVTMTRLRFAPRRGDHAKEPHGECDEGGPGDVEHAEEHHAQ